MTDQEFLNWIADRIVNRYGESESTDFILRLRQIADADTGAGAGPNSFLGVPDEQIIDLGGRPIDMQRLLGILCFICDGKDTLIRNGARETAIDIMHRMEIAHIAAHEARIRKSWEQG